MSSTPLTGQAAPAFELPNADNETRTLSDYAGQWLVLYFYPKDDTPGCTKEAIGFSEALEDFRKHGAQVVGISKDTVAKHGKFRDKHDLSVELLSDEAGDTVEAFGAWVEKSMYGRTYMGIDRSTFLINPDGKILEEWRKVRVPGHVDKVLNALAAHVNEA